jgi:hypothetical protein
MGSGEKNKETLFFFIKSIKQVIQTEPSGQNE